MSERYTSGEAMEHVEKAHEFLEKSEHALLRHVPLLAAALALALGNARVREQLTHGARLVRDRLPSWEDASARMAEALEKGPRERLQR